MSYEIRIIEKGKLQPYTFLAGYNYQGRIKSKQKAQRMLNNLGKTTTLDITKARIVPFKLDKRSKNIVNY